MLRSGFSVKTIKENLWVAIILGSLSSLLILGLAAALASLLLIGLENPSEQIGLASLAVILLSAMISGFALSVFFGKDGFVRALISLLIAAIAFVVIGGCTGGITTACLMNAASYLGTGALSAFIGRPRSRRHRRPR